MSAIQTETLNRKVTIILSAIAGLLIGFGFLNRTDQYAFMWTSWIDRFFKWLIYTHTNAYILLIMPVAAMLLCHIIHRLIDSAMLAQSIKKANKADQATPRKPSD